jgi:hypothetical protein
MDELLKIYLKQDSMKYEGRMTDFPTSLSPLNEEKM